MLQKYLVVEVSFNSEFTICDADDEDDSRGTRY